MESFGTGFDSQRLHHKNKSLRSDVMLFCDNELWCFRQDEEGVWRCNNTNCFENTNNYCSDEDFDVTGLCPME